MDGSMHRTIQIGLTGSIGMGKSTISKHFKALGFPVFDADAAVHALYSLGGAAVSPIAEIFPEAVICGAVDRTILSKLVLESPDSIKRLEALVHPLVRKEREAFYSFHAAQGQLLVLYDIPLLFENPTHQTVDYTIVASAGSETQKRRVLQRPNMTPEKLRSILSKQMPDLEKRRLADFVVLTDVWDDSFAPARAQVASIIETIVLREPKVWESWKSRKSWKGRSGLNAGIRANVDSVKYVDSGGVRSVEQSSAWIVGTSTGTTIATTSSVSSTTTTSSDIPKSPSRIREAFDVVLFDLDDTLVPVLPPLQAAAAALSSFLQRRFPKVHATLLAEGGGSISKGLSPRMQAVIRRLPLLAHDLSEVRRLALLDALRESKGLPPLFGAAQIAASPPASPRGPSSPRVSSSTKLSPDKMPDQGPFQRGGMVDSAKLGLDPLVAKQTLDLSQRATGDSQDICSPVSLGLVESEIRAITEAMEVFLAARSDVAPHLYPDTLPLLEHLQQHGIALGIVTNGNANMVKFYGGKLFRPELCFTSCDTGVLKPSVVPFLAAIHAADVPPARILFVGDSLDKDVAGARACGMAACWLNRSADSGVFLASDVGDAQPDLTISSLAPQELEDKLAEFLDRSGRK